MKSNRLTLLSLAFNVALAAACALLAARRPAAMTAAVSPEPAAGHRVIEAHPAPVIAQDNPPPAQPRPWAEVLRSQGVPEKVIARLAAADCEDRWQARQSKAQEDYNRGDLDADGLAALARQHDIEEESDLRARLGEEAFRAWDAARLFQQFNLGSLHLTRSETNALYDLAATHRQRLRDLEKAKADNQIDQATLNAEQSNAEADFNKQLRALLGEERYGALHGTDPAVGDLRRSLRGLTVDDQGFATLLQAQQQWDAARTQLEQRQVETGDTNYQQQINALTTARDQAFANVLGTNGLALFLKQQDSRYVELEKNAARWGMDIGSIDYVFGTIQTYEAALADYQRQVRELEARGVNIDPDKSQQQWHAYAGQMAQYVRSNLSDAQYDALSRNEMLPFANP